MEKYDFSGTNIKFPSQATQSNADQTEEAGCVQCTTWSCLFGGCSAGCAPAARKDKCSIDRAKGGSGSGDA